MKVLNFGSLNIDYVYQVDHMVNAKETLSSLGMHVFLGGKGLNQSIALAKAGVNVYHAGLIGEGGEAFLPLCKKYGVNTELIQTVEGKNGHTIIQVDKTGQNCILLYGGSNQKVDKPFVAQVLSRFKEGDLLLLQNEISSLSYIIDEAYKKKMTIVLNPSPFNDTIKKCKLEQVSIFLINEVEGQQMTGESYPDKIIETLKERYPKAKIVLTLGEDGVIYADADSMIYQKAEKAEVVDTTAAGDTFTGYFIAGLLNELPIKENLLRCVKASAITVSKMGAADSIPTKEEVCKRTKM